MKTASFKYILASALLAGTAYSRFITPRYTLAWEGCDMKSNDKGIFIHDELNAKNQEYACLIPFTSPDSEVNLDNSVCFVGNGETLCVASEDTTYQECNMEDSKYDLQACVKKIFKLSQRNGFEWQSNLEKSNGTKLTYDKKLDEKECSEQIDGEFLEDEEGNYVCVYRPLRHHIASTICYGSEDENKRDLCVFNKATSIKVCKTTSSKKSYNQCYEQLLKLSPELSNIKKLDFEEYKN